MDCDKINLVYFSATATTKKTLRYIADGVGIKDITSYDITRGDEKNIAFGDSEMVVFGVPVYAGRMPSIAVESVKKFRGNNTPAIVVCVYGNRDFDDALLELRDIALENGFKVISAAAFVAQHSIFPNTGLGRPDNADKEIAANFGAISREKLRNIKDIKVLPDIEVKGNFPYKEAKGVPLKPKANKKCTSCGTCVRLCPVQAIDENNPRRTNETLCISCAKCIYVCPEKSRRFGGLLYKIASRKFSKAYADRKEPYLVY